MARQATRTVAVVAALAASCLAMAAGSEVYKCTLQGGRILYSDAHCQGGSVVDVDGGTADPRAIARLERDDAAFNGMMWERRLAEERAALARSQLMAQSVPPEPAVAEAVGGGWQYFDPGYAYAVPSNAKRHAQEHRHTRSRAPRVVPAAPSPLMAGRVTPR